MSEGRSHAGPTNRHGDRAEDRRDPSYESTGGQEPFKGDSSETNGQFCGGATLWPGFNIGPARIGVDASVCSGSNAFGAGDTMLFKIPRHGPGDVTLTASSDVIIDLMFKGEVALGPNNNWFLSGGVGPTFRELDLKLTSDQSFFGCRLERRGLDLRLPCLPGDEALRSRRTDYGGLPTHP